MGKSPVDRELAKESISSSLASVFFSRILMMGLRNVGV